MRVVADAATLSQKGNVYFGDSISDGDEFDYIVVGAGAAGSVVAARLTMAGFNVLLVEAGGDPNFFTKIPGATFAFSGSSMDWNYETQPNNKSCLGSKGQRCRLSRGRCLGGSTSINYMMYTRGNRHDYEFNVTGWTWEDMEPYFLRFEGLRDLYSLPKSSESYHNTSGIMSIGYFEDSGNPWHHRLIGGLKSLNFSYNPDVNAKSQIGVSKIFGYILNGERVSTATAYLGQKTVKKKLKIAKNSQCTGVIIDGDNIARGVTISRGFNDKLRVFAKHEVILSAGTFNSAQLLMLSGVGPKEHLEEFNIPVKADLPVGDEMSDQVLPIINIKVDHDAKSLYDPNNIISKGLDALQWVITRSGPLASNGLTDVTAFFNTNCYNYSLRSLINDRSECEIPTTQFIYSYIEKGIVNPARTIYEASTSYNNDILQQILSENEESAYIIVSPVLLRPESRGWVRLTSSDPLAHPLITPNYLDDERDLQEFIRSIRILEQLVETPIYKKYNASIQKLHLLGCPDIDADGYWECFVRHTIHSAHHAVGTVALGPVLDERLRVRGIKRLRVADASVLPLVPRGNTAAAVIAIGERISDFLIQDRELEFKI
ncbi:unnamed protein product, partial [Brenthis ino]